MHRPGDGLELLVVPVLPSKIELSAEVLLEAVGNGNPTRLCERLEATGDIDAVTMKAAMFRNDLALIGADVEERPPIGRNGLIATVGNLQAARVRSRAGGAPPTVR